jgi:hypothetical protein
LIGFQCFDEAFGKAATDQQAVAGGQGGVFQGVEEYGFGTGGCQGIKVIGVIEAKSGVAGDGDAHRGRRAGGTCRWSDQRLFAATDGQQLPEINLIADSGGDGVNVAFGFCSFIGRHQPQMAFDQGELGIFLHRTDYRYVRVVFNDRAQLAFMATATEAVEDYPGNS